MFGVSQLVFWLIASLLDTFDSQNIEVFKLNGDIIDFFINSEYSKYPIYSFFFTCYAAETTISFPNLKKLLKLPEKG